jgi:hypothetical protein
VEDVALFFCRDYGMRAKGKRAAMPAEEPVKETKNIRKSESYKLAIVKSFRGKGPQTTAAKFRQSAMNAAKHGKELARSVCNWSSKQIRRSRKVAKINFEN